MLANASPTIISYSQIYLFTTKEALFANSPSITSSCEQPWQSHIHFHVGWYYISQSHRYTVNIIRQLGGQYIKQKSINNIMKIR